MRQRDLFPLPAPFPGAGELCHAGIEPPAVGNNGQTIAYVSLTKCMPPAELTCAGTYLELCGSSLLSEGDGPVPYDRDLVSLHDVGDSAVPCEPLLTSARRDLVEGGHA
eukprot:7616361-Heterocapsa_arctica.AAC.1